MNKKEQTKASGFVGGEKTIRLPSTFTTNTSTQRCMMQNFLLWLDDNIDEAKEDCQNSIIHLRRIANTVHTFTDVDRCVDFLTEIKDEKAFMILSGALSQNIVPFIHDISQLAFIYVFCDSESCHQQWAKEWPKVNGIFTQIASICDSLQQVAQQCDQNSISISLVPVNVISNQNLDELDRSFIYTQLLKEALLEIDDDDSKSIKELVAHCRIQYAGNPLELEKIAQFERDYRLQTPIYWYTCQWFLYSTLNRALRNLEVDIILKMGFFLRDLHRHIEQLHLEQSGEEQGRFFIVYRGQGLSKIDFEKLTQTRGGLMSFNNFLSTSADREVSLAFAESNQGISDSIGILFEITIDQSSVSASFANLHNISNFQSEREILFSMHTVFRIGNIKQIDESDRLWSVELTLTSDNDPELNALATHIREETQNGPKGWNRLSKLLIKMGEFDKADQICQILFNRESDNTQRAHLYFMLGITKTHQGEYKEAISFAEKGLEMYQNIFPSNDPNFASAYKIIGGVYYNMGEYSKALSFNQKALEIDEKNFPPNRLDLSSSYNNIGTIYKDIGENSKALSFYEKALDIEQKILPPNHPSLAISSCNIGGVYYNMGDYSKTLSFWKKALEIKKKCLPPNHPDLASSYSNISGVCCKIGDYPEAISFFEKALEIRLKTLPANHPDLATSYNTIGSVYTEMGEYSKGLSFYSKALEAYQKTLPPKHPLLASCYNNIGVVYCKMGEYSKALSSCEKAVEISQKALPLDHPDFAESYNNIGLIYYYMNDCSKALFFYDKALEIKQKALPPNHPSLASSYNNIAGVYNNRGEYSKALSFYEKALDIEQKTLPLNHHSLATSYNNIGLMYYNMRECLKALSFYENALEIFKKTLPSNHPFLASSYNNMGSVYYTKREYSKALFFYEKALEIKEKTLPPNHPDLATSYSNIGGVYKDMGEYPKALSFCGRAVKIGEKLLPPNHPTLQQLKDNVEVITREFAVSLSGLF